MDATRAARPLKSFGPAYLALGGRVLLAAVLVTGVIFSLGTAQNFLNYAPYAAVGGVLVIRQPRNVIGWLVVAIAVLNTLSAQNVPGPVEPLVRGTAPLWERVLAWATVVAGPLTFLAFSVLAVVFPSGRLPEGRWGLAVRITLALMGVAAVAIAIGPTISVTLPDGSDVNAANPFGILPPLTWWDAFSGGAVFIGLTAASAVAAAWMVVRLRRSQGLERLQLRWVVVSLVFVCGSIGFGLVTSIWIPATLAIPTVPLAIGIAVLRYRLYEIDILINRSAVYGVVTLVLVGLLGLGNLVLQQLLDTVGGQQLTPVAAFGGGIAVAFAFGPLRRRVRPLVDRVLPARAVVTLLFTDIVGSTQAVVELGDARWRGLLGQYLAAVRGELGRHGGREINTAGDAFFATFNRPEHGLACAVAIRSTVRSLGLETRTGLHFGEVELRGEQPSGLAVHTAARIMAAAGDGEILLSDDLRTALGDDGLPLADRGLHGLRGVPGQWRLFAAEPSDGG
jgi:class 3 adenylate cyclase